MERMTRRGQAPVKKELVEASMSAFVFWMGTIAIGYMLVANSGWSLPLFPLLFFIFLNYLILMSFIIAFHILYNQSL